MSFWTNLGSTMTAAVSAVQATGLTPAQSISAVQAVFGSELSAIQPNLTAIMDNYTDAAVIGDECVKIKESSGWPGTTAANAVLADMQANAGNLKNIMTDITDLKNLLG